MRERFRTDQKLNWLIDNRLAICQDLNLGMLCLMRLNVIFIDMCECRCLEVEEYPDVAGISHRTLS